MNCETWFRAHEEKGGGEDDYEQTDTRDAPGVGGPFLCWNEHTSCIRSTFLALASL